MIINILLLKNLKSSPAENFSAKLNQANLVNKSDFDKKLTSFNKQIKRNIWKFKRN